VEFKVIAADNGTLAGSSFGPNLGRRLQAIVAYGIAITGIWGVAVEGLTWIVFREGSVARITVELFLFAVFVALWVIGGLADPHRRKE